MTKLGRNLRFGLGTGIALAALLSLVPAAALAQTSCVCPDGTTVPAPDANACAQLCGAAAGTKPPTGGTPTTGTGGTTQATSPIDNPISFCGTGSKAVSGQKCVQLIIGNIIKAALGIVGSIALLMMTWGGFRWLTAMGNSEKVEKGKDVLIWATLGLIIIFGAYALTNYVIGALSK